MVLIVGFIIVLILCHYLAFSNTMALKNDYKTLRQEALLLENTPKQLSLLKQKQKYYDSLLNKYQIKGSSVQNNLLKTINRFSKENNLKIASFLEPHLSKNNDLTIKTYQFTIQGHYNSLLKLIYHLEQETKFGEIINLHFEKKKNYKTGKFYLQVHVLLKSFG